MKRSLFNGFIGLILVIAIALGPLTVCVTGDGTPSATDEIPYIPHDTSLAEQIYDSAYTVYDGSSAAAAGVPSGYSGYVVKVAGNTDSAYGGLCLDFSSQKIPIDSVDSITFRVYMSSATDGLRMKKDDASVGTWVMEMTPGVTGEWTEVTLCSDGTNFKAGNMQSLQNSDGNLGAFCLIGRFRTSSRFYYLDSVTVKYKAGASSDTTPPVITYTGLTELTVAEGEAFSLQGISAYDEYDGAAASVTYEWSEGAVDNVGAMNTGTHTCTVVATDRTGNRATLTLTVTVKADSSKLLFDVLPHLERDLVESNATYNGTGTAVDYTEAAGLGLPEGYSGSVTRVEYKGSNSYVGLCLDFSDSKIPVSIIETITFRVYVPSNYSELRMKNENTSDWIIRSAAAVTSGWYDIILTASGTNFYSGDMTTLANADGNLGAMWLIGRNTSTFSPYYVDSVTVKLKTDDGVAPVITYDGEKNITTSAEKPFVIDASAYDELEDREIALSYDWSEGAVDTNGKLVQGEHTCTVSAVDFYGNTSSLVLNVSVGARDTEAPKILFYADEITALTGSYYRFNVSAVDNYDAVGVTEIWSEGALDPVGRLLAGEHTLTLISVDLTGNITEKIIAVHVSDTDADVGTLITPDA